MIEATQFFEFVNERERIRLQKEAGVPAPWTDDPVLQAFRFCNVFREDDRTTRYFAKTVREPLRDSSQVVMSTIAWRWFNRIETCSRLTLREWKELDTDNMRAALRDCNPLVTGAFLVKTPNGMSKLEGILWCIDEAWKALSGGPYYGEDDPDFDTLEEAHEWLVSVPFLGRFMAYEVVTDLRHTYLLEDAPDIMTWASAGPGCCRGAGRVLAGDPTRFPYGTQRSVQETLALMRELLVRSRSQWDWGLRPWEMREVEHCLCEYDKYRRAQEGGRLKRRYQPS